MAKTRSPNYPFIPLETALQRARKVWDEEGRHAAAPETVVGHWGYASKSSGGRQTIAALRHFGLLDGRGAVQLTELGQSILLSEAGSTSWLQRVREAALNPVLHREIWTKYDGELPSDQNLRYYLVMERAFGESGAAEFIQELRATFAFARMAEQRTDTLSNDPEDKAEDEDEMESTLEEENATDRRNRRQVQLPYSATDWAVLQASFPLTDDEWTQMLAVLTAMRPALTNTSE